MAKQTFTTGSVLTATQMNDLQTNDFNWTVNQKTTSYVLVASDKGTRIEMNSGSATTVTVNTGLFSAGDTLFIQNIGTGVCTITAGTATVQKASNASLALAQYQGGYLYFVSASNAVFFADAGFTSPLTTKGDLFTWDTGNARLAVGTNGQVLTADSTAATGLKWAAVSSATTTSWTPTVSQGGTITQTSVVANYIKTGDYVFAEAYIGFLSGASGSAGSTITISTPTTIADSNGNGRGNRGGGYLTDNSASASYPAWVIQDTTTTVKLMGTTNSNGSLSFGNTGANFAAGLAQNDIIYVTFSYRSA